MAYRPSPKKISILVSIVILIFLGIFFRKSITNFFSKDDVNSSAYQAVFLANGQVYFGKISKIENDYVELTNIFYLQANNQLQAASTGDTSPSSSQMSLVKLGNELHGPTDAMYINRIQILFFENLKPDSRVVTAIDTYQNSNNASGNALQF